MTGPDATAADGMGALIGTVGAPPGPADLAEAVRLRWSRWSGPEGPGTPVAGAGAIGALAPLAVWAATVTGRARPEPFTRIRHVVFVAEPGSPEVLDPARELLAETAGATVRTVPVGAMAVSAAVALGARIADEEADGGADLVIPAVWSAGATVPAVVVIAALTGSEPVRALGFDAYTPDPVWIERCTAVRDLLHRVARPPAGAGQLLVDVGASDLAAAAGFLARGAARRTPALLDGLGVAAAALVAADWAAEARDWWLAVNGPGTAGERLAYEALGLRPATSTGTRLGDGTGALLALPLLSTALGLLALTPAEDGA